MCPDFRRGAEAIAKAQERDSGGSFRQFTPSLFWKSDQEEKYLLFLNEIEEIPEVQMISYIPQTGKKKNGDSFEYYESVIARTEPAIGESSDPMVDKWDGNPKRTCIAVAVELEPTFEEVKGRQRPTGFAVKTTEFDRRIRDEAGELTTETETVEAPVIGFVAQSPHNFFNVVTSYDANDAPIHETALKVTRVGSGNSTTYSIAGFPEQEIDLGGLVDCVDGISYLGDELDNLLDEMDELDSDLEMATLIGTYMLDKRLDELCDRERYDEIFQSITKSLDKWGAKKGDKDKPATKRERPQRRSQRRGQSEPEAEASEPEAEAPEVEEAPAEKPARRSRRVEPKTAAEEAPAVEDAPEAEEKPARRARAKAETSSPANSKLDALRARNEKRKAATA